jgi:hypothetical protein
MQLAEDVLQVVLDRVLADNQPRHNLLIGVTFSEAEAGLKPLAQDNVQPNAHVVAVDPDTGHVYLPIANLGAQPVIREASLMTDTVGDNDD